MAQRLIRVMIVHDMEIVRAGLTSLLDLCDDIVVVASVDRLEAPIDESLCTELRVDVVLADPYRPRGGGSDAIERLLRSRPQVRVVTIAGSRDDDAVRFAVQAGAAACVRITVGQTDLAHAIRGAVQGRFVVPSEVLSTLVSATIHETTPTALTAREDDVLSLLAEGQTNKDIARALGLTGGTVRGHVSMILTKLGVTNRTEATGVAIRGHLIHPRTTQPTAEPPRGP